MRETTRSSQEFTAWLTVHGTGPWSTQQLRGKGWTVARIRAAVAAGRIVRISHGMYAANNAESPDRITLAAVLSRLGPRAVLSHATAAGMHGLWLPGRTTEQTHVTISGSPERRRGCVRIHGSRLLPSAVTTFDGFPVTTIARTALDLARGAALSDAMIVTDSAARALIVAAGHDPSELRSMGRRNFLRQHAADQLRAAFADVWTWPGTVVARAAIDLVDPCSESPAESRSRCWIVEAKLPMPLTAYRVRGASGRIYYADFAWPDRRVLGEVDGFEKYGETPQQQRARLRAERLRQADLEDAGWTVVRWSTADSRASVIARIKRVLGE